MLSLGSLPDFVIRIFPKKKVVGFKEKDFVEMRRDQLQNYLRGVIMAIIKRPLSPMASNPTMTTLITEVPFLGPDHIGSGSGNQDRKSSSKLSLFSDTASIYSVAPAGDDYVDLPPQNSPVTGKLQAREESPVWKRKKDKDLLNDDDDDE